MPVLRAIASFAMLSKHGTAVELVGTEYTR